MTSFDTGRRAETAAADYLRQHGFGIIGQNLRTRSYEIDIIAQRDGIVYFVEVKYRRNDAAGGGLEYITPRKLKQMQFAAESWRSENRHSGAYRLAGIEVSGSDFAITDFIDSLT
jgi:putative endonuclease